MIIKENLDNYLGFDSKEFFIDPLVRIFGGAIRDTICGDPINDIDILCGTNSFNYLRELLFSKGYIYYDEFVKRDLERLYSEISVISVPHTFIKGKSIVQLIRPRVNINRNDAFHIKKSLYEKNFIKLLQNVDISCCGVSWDGENLYQNLKDSVLHCKNKVFFINNGSLMLTKRLDHRRYKLLDRGWKEIKNGLSDTIDLKIDDLLEGTDDFIFKNEF